MATYIRNKKMNSHLSVFLILFMILSIVNIAAPVTAQSADGEKEKILTGIEQRYGGKEFTASYEQTSILKALDVNETASGKVFFSHPGKMRWEYSAPEVHQIITDGINLWIYKPDEKQVSKGSAAQFFKDGAGSAFLSDISTMRKNYTISVNSGDASFIEMTMIPKKKNQDIVSITITVAKDTYNIKKVVTFNGYGDATELLFSDVSFTPLDPSLFEFSIPNGVDIIYMD